MRKSLLFSGLALALVLGACADAEIDGDDDGPEAAPTATAGIGGGDLDETCAEVSAPEGAPAGVTMQDNFFEPPCVAVSSEQSVNLTNAGNLNHNFTIQGTEISEDVEPGEDEDTEELGDHGVSAGTYRFFCRFHERDAMVGTIVVE
ncbi:MAG TPA: cupredoxin domain-containing protein [Actinomycetota bacterium]|nr:cupredoxin domain-containing protein [Actinomycetota bacterium]